jgi:hypothetical protein
LYLYWIMIYRVLGEIHQFTVSSNKQFAKISSVAQSYYNYIVLFYHLIIAIDITNIIRITYWLEFLTHHRILKEFETACVCFKGRKI